MNMINAAVLMPYHMYVEVSKGINPLKLKLDMCILCSA